MRLLLLVCFAALTLGNSLARSKRGSNSFLRSKRGDNSLLRSKRGGNSFLRSKRGDNSLLRSKKRGNSLENHVAEIPDNMSPLEKLVGVLALELESEIGKLESEIGSQGLTQVQIQNCGAACSESDCYYWNKCIESWANSETDTASGSELESEIGTEVANSIEPSLCLNKITSDSDGKKSCQEMCTDVKDAYGYCDTKFCKKENSIVWMYANCPNTCGFCPKAKATTNMGKCCKAMTAKCLACAKRLTVEEYCTQSPLTLGCPMETSCVTAEIRVKDDEECCEGLVSTAGQGMFESMNWCRKNTAVTIPEGYDVVGKGWCRGGAKGRKQVNGIYNTRTTASECVEMCNSLQTCSGYAFDATDSSDPFCRLFGSMKTKPSGWRLTKRTPTVITASSGQMRSFKITCYRKNAKVELECVKEGKSVMGGYKCCTGLVGVTKKKRGLEYTVCRKPTNVCYDYDYDLCYHKKATSKVCASMLDNNPRHGAIYQRVGSVYKSGRDCYRAKTACWNCLTPYYRNRRTDALENLGQCSTPCLAKSLSEQLLAKLVRKLLE